MEKKKINFKDFEIIKVGQKQIIGGSAPDCSNGGTRCYPSACSSLS